MSQQDKPKELRASLYFSRRKDKDILTEISFEGLEKGDINWILKELMRDGIKFRKGVYPSSRIATPPPHAEPTTAIPTNYTLDVAIPSPSITPEIVYQGFEGEDDLDGFELKEKELDEDDIADKLADF